MHIVILAGGFGTRLWPMSTPNKPKQFQKILSEKSMLRETYERCSFADSIYVSTNECYVDLVKECIPELPENHIIAEPCYRETGPCIGLAAALIQKKDPKATMAVVYADHMIDDKKEFENKLEKAAEIAKTQNKLCIVEVPARFPSTNLGYVRIGSELETDVFEFEGFTEKPDKKTAESFLELGNYMWNTGLYVWQTKDILDAFKAHQSKTYSALMQIKESGDLKSNYKNCDKISIDYGVMEKLKNDEVRIIRAHFNWSDIGNWDAIHTEKTASKNENLEKGKLASFQNEGAILYNESKTPMLAVGLKDVVVINTEEGLLVCSREASKNLKPYLEKLNEEISPKTHP